MCTRLIIPNVLNLWRAVAGMRVRRTVTPVYLISRADLGRTPQLISPIYSYQPLPNFKLIINYTSISKCHRSRVFVRHN